MKKGEEYEKLSEEVVQALNHGKKVTHNVKIKGSLTEVKRQIDVKLDKSEYDFVMYECKDWKATVGIDVVEKLIGDLEDVGAKHGAIIANSPYTKGAKNLASKKGVDLLHLVKTDNPKSKIGISVMVLAREKVVEAVAYALEDSSLNGGNIDFNPNSLQIVEDGKRYNLKQLLKKRWNEGYNVQVEVGQNTLELHNPTVVGLDGELTRMTKITYTVIVKENYFEGPWIVKEAQGLYNVNEDTFHAYGNMKSATMSVKDMEKKFKPVEPEKLNQEKYSIILDIASKFT